MQRIAGTEIIEAFAAKNNTTSLFKENKEIVSVKNADVVYFDDYINLQTVQDSIYVAHNGEVVDNSVVLDNDLFAVNQNGKWGFVDKNKEVRIEPEYDFVTEFNEYGFAGVQKDGKWGCVSINGEVVVEPQYEFEFNNPFFVGKYYRYELEYGEEYFLCE